MKALPKFYSEKVRGRLGYFPVWQPGETVQPGDVGRIKRGVFYRETSLSQIFPTLEFPSLDLKLSENAGKASVGFCSDNKISATGGAGGSLAASDQQSASVRFTFSSNGGVIFHASGISVSRLQNLNNIRRTISENRDRWPRNWVLVSQVESATRYAVLLSQSGGWSFEGSGSADALQQMYIADASVEIAAVSGAGYKYIGSGPVLLRLYGLGVLDGILGLPPSLLSTDTPIPETSEFHEISPDDPALDDPTLDSLGDEERDGV